MMAQRTRWRAGSATLAILVFFATNMVGASRVDAGQIQLSIRADSATLVYDQNFPDPSVLVVGHKYFAYSTNSGGENVPVIESDDLTHWKAIGDSMSVLAPWVSEGLVWSPSVTPAPGGGYELFFSAYDQAAGAMCLGRATSASPLGPFVNISGTPFLCQVGAGGSIDPSVYRFDGVDYLVWKGDGETGQPQTILSARLAADDTRIVSEPTTLLTASEAWEDGVVEGPTLIDASGVLRLYFSGGHWSSSDYAIGEATCTSPLGPCGTTDVQPLTIPSRSATGSGGPSFFTTQGRTYMAFAAWSSGVVGNEHGHRALLLMLLGEPQSSALTNPTGVLMKRGLTTNVRNR